MTTVAVRKQDSPLKKWKQYIFLQESGADWVVQIPSHWQAGRIRYVARLESGHTPSRQHPEYWIDCTIPWFTLADVWQLRDGTCKYVNETEEKISELGLANSAARLLPKGTVILSRTASVGFTGILDRPMATSQDFVNWICGPRILPEYLWYVFRGMRQEFERLMMGSTHQTIYMPQVQSFATPIPSIPEQRAIIRFLNRETAKLDTLIARKQRLIELLQEKRAALISQLVTGSDRIPEVRLGHHLDLLAGFAFPSSGFSYDDEDVRLLRGVNVNPDSIRWEEVVRWPRSDAPLFCRYELKIGDLVIGMDRPWVSTGIRVSEITREDVPSLLLQRVARLRARCGLDQQYLKVLLSSVQFRSYFEPILTGVSVPHISPEQIQGFRFRLPSLDEQMTVCRRVRGECSHIEELIQRLRVSVERLREYHTALISAVVTGKIDVRGEVE